MLKALKIGNLVAEKPIIQGGMGIGVSLSNLAGAVAKNGAIGVISAAQIGFREPDFGTNPLGANLRALKREIQRAKEIAEGGIIGVNIMVAMKNYAEYVKCCVESKVDIIISGAGLPAELPKLVEGSDVKIAPIVSPPKAAKTLLKLWDKRYQRAADMVIIEGPLAGGHLGFTTEDVNKYEEIGYDKEILEVIEIVKEYEEKYEKDIPVIFAGGVYDKADIQHYMNLGCSGVQMGTRFVATKECDVDIKFKEAYVNAKEEDVVLTLSPVGMPGRAIENPMIKISKEKKLTPNACYQCLRDCDIPSIPYCITSALVSAAKGDTQNALLFCGSNVHKIDRIMTVKELLDQLTDEE